MGQKYNFLLRAYTLQILQHLFVRVGREYRGMDMITKNEWKQLQRTKGNDFRGCKDKGLQRDGGHHAQRKVDRQTSIKARGKHNDSRILEAMEAAIAFDAILSTDGRGDCTTQSVVTILIQSCAMEV